MNKPYLLRGKLSPDRVYDFSSADYRSVQRGFANSRTSPYKSEFDLDGTLHRRSTFYSPPRLSPRSSRAFLAAKAAVLGLPRSGGVSNWSRDPTLSSGISRPSAGSPDVQRSDSPQASEERHSKTQGAAAGMAPPSGAADESRHRDLKRKMVFDLHKEIGKPIHTTHLEEISDMDEITDICFSNLRVMMENKKHRKFLHHMNNNASVETGLLLRKTHLNYTNNAGQPSRLSGQDKKPVMSSINARRLVKDGTLARKASLKPPEMIQAVSPIDPLKFRGPKHLFQSFALKAKQEYKSKLSLSSDPGQVQPEVPEVKPELPVDPTMIFLQELEDHRDKAIKPTGKQAVMMSPEEVLACHYLRLNQDQVRRLEKMIRDRGADPGIHVHMDVTNYDVFSEVRRIRVAQKQGATFSEIIDDEDEDENAVTKRKTIRSQPGSSAASAANLASAHSLAAQSSTRFGAGKRMPGPAHRF